MMSCGIWGSAGRSVNPENWRLGPGEPPGVRNSLHMHSFRGVLLHRASFPVSSGGRPSASLAFRSRPNIRRRRPIPGLPLPPRCSRPSGWMARRNKQQEAGLREKPDQAGIAATERGLKRSLSSERPASSTASQATRLMPSAVGALTSASVPPSGQHYCPIRNATAKRFITIAGCQMSVAGLDRPPT